MKQIIIHGQGLKVTKAYDPHAPADRLETITVEGNMRSPSDGYHTFDELYDHRITLFIALCRHMHELLGMENPGKFKVWRSRKHSDGSEYEGWYILGIGTDAGKQITYHIPMSRWEETDWFTETHDKAPKWDGHTSADVLERIKAL